MPDLSRIPEHERLPAVWLVDQQLYVMTLDFWWIDPKTGIALFFKKGWTFDGASIPMLLEWGPLLTRHDLSELAIGAHDLLYGFAGRPPGIQPEDASYTRYGADLLFHDINLRHGVKYRKAITAYAGVRAGGWRPWNAAESRLLKGGFLHAYR